MKGKINIIITIQAEKGEGIAFTAGKIATTFSNSRNVIIIADKDEIRDKACIVPYAPTIEIEYYEWENFQDNIIEYLIKSNNGMEEQLFLYLIIDDELGKILVKLEARHFSDGRFTVDI